MKIKASIPAALALSLLMSALLAACALPRDVPTQGSADGSLRDQYGNLQNRLNKLNTAGRYSAQGKYGEPAAATLAHYQWAKAQCWVRNAYSEQHERDASGFSAQALAEAQKIVTGLEANNNTATSTPLINHQEAARPDLWQRANDLKQHKGYACAAATVACLEVQLSRSGHELNDLGWRHANSYLAVAEDMTAKAQQEADTCVPPLPPQPPAPPPPPATILPVPSAPVTPPPAPVKSVEKLTLNASALFRFDKRAQGDLLPQGKAELDQLAERLSKVYASVESIELVGHTDRLGTDAYNQTLSQDRANTVRAYLQGKGVSAAMNASGKGKNEPVVNCTGGNVVTPKLTECLQPNRRVEITITGVKR